MQRDEDFLWCQDEFVGKTELEFSDQFLVWVKVFLCERPQFPAGPLLCYYTCSILPQPNLSHSCLHVISSPLHGARKCTDWKKSWANSRAYWILGHLHLHPCGYCESHMANLSRVGTLYPTFSLVIAWWNCTDSSKGWFGNIRKETDLSNVLV